VDEICSLLSSRARGGVELDADELEGKSCALLPEPSATEPQPVRADPAVVHSVAVRGIRSFGPGQTLRLAAGRTIVYAGNGERTTSLTDAFELLTDGETTRNAGLPFATSEARDKDHITHRPPHGTPDPAHPPRVTVRYRRGEELHTCEWSSF